MKLAFLATLLLSLTSHAGSTTVMKCTVGKIGAEGVRVNVIKSATGELKANLIHGTTISGTTYHIAETSPGVFEGSIKNKPQFPIKLVVSSEAAVNKYILGSKASLQVIYPDLTSATGSSTDTTTDADTFVCGKQIADYSK